MPDLPPHSDLAIRPAAAGDIPAIAAIERISFDTTGERFDEPKITYLIGSPRVTTLVAELDARLLGWATGFTWTRGLEPWGRIYGLAIHPDARGRKLGPRLLRHLIDALRRRGAGAIFLEVRVDNHAAIGLYRKTGFIPCGQLHNFYAPAIHAHRMRLSPPG